MKTKLLPIVLCTTALLTSTVFAGTEKPNIILIVSDDTGWGDLGVYGGGEGRGMPTPNLDKLAEQSST